MFNVGDYVIHNRELCKIKDIKDNNVSGEDKYYVLNPIDDKSLTISVPINNKNESLRSVISKEIALNLIKEIPKIEIIDSNDKLIESEYKALMNSNTFEGLIKIIKTTYMRNDERLKANKKIGEKDKFYFEKAGKYLYDEFSIALEMTFDEVKTFVINEVKTLL